MIDHGAALYFQHRWQGYLERSQQPFAAIKDHVLLPFVRPEDLDAVDAQFSDKLTSPVLTEILARIPDDWLVDPFFEAPAEQRQAYQNYLERRLSAPRAFVQEAIRVRQHL